MSTSTREHPLLFSGPMVRALLDGRKTQTRRLVTPKTSLLDGDSWPKRMRDGMDWANAWIDKGPSPAGNPGPYLKVPFPAEETVHRVYPIWQVGNALWVRETAWYDREPVQLLMEDLPIRCFYEGREVRSADGRSGEAPYASTAATLDLNDALRKRPGIHMPRWASRLTLRVTSVRVERLQEITDTDAIAEGIGPFANSLTIDCDTESPRRVFGSLWDSINGERAPWASNPWVWCVSFERVP